MIPNGESHRFWIALAAPILLLAVGAGEAAAETPAVRVESAGDQITLRVMEPSDLSVVLEALCGHIQARCDGLSAAADTPVQPLTITGDWRSVLRQLFEGSGLNYIALAPVQNQPGRLLVAARPAPPVEAATEAGRDSDRDVEWVDRVLRDETPRGLLERQMQLQEDSASETEAATNPGPPIAPVPFVVPPGTVALPFPGADNFPILAPVLNAQPGLSSNPFPDANGNALHFPAAGQPVVGSPFPGLNGQPISVSPAPASQGSPNPFGPPAPPK